MYQQLWGRAIAGYALCSRANIALAVSVLFDNAATVSDIG